MGLRVKIISYLKIFCFRFHGLVLKNIFEVFVQQGNYTKFWPFYLFLKLLSIFVFFSIGLV